MKNEKQVLVPRLRFPEFREAGEWEEKELALYLQSHSERVGATDNELPIYSSTREGLKFQKDYYDGRELVNEGEYGVVPEGYIVYRHMSDDTIFKFNLNDTGGRIVVSKEYPVFTTVGLNSGFLLQKLNGGLDFKRYAESQRKGGTRTRLYFKTLCNWKTLLPEPEEQQKIADCLSSLDALIAAQADKIDALKSHKKGLMQQLYPREGETVPRMRFFEFRGAGEWNEVKLSTQIELISGLHLAPSEYADSGDIPYFTGPSDYTNNSALVTKWTNRSANVARNGDTLVTVKGSGVGELLLLHLSEVAMGRQLMAVRAKKACEQFIYHVLSMKRQQMIALASGNLIPGLSRGDILGLDISVPGLKEQQRIADFLSSLDALIAAYAEQFDVLKAHKKGLMQQLFPKVELE